MNNSYPQLDLKPQPLDLKSEALPTELAGETLKSDPVEKWLPGSIFNVKKYSSGHFSTLKADTGQILTLDFELKVVKKWLPPRNFYLHGGHVPTISSHWK